MTVGYPTDLAICVSYAVRQVQAYRTIGMSLE